MLLYPRTTALLAHQPIAHVPPAILPRLVRLTAFKRGTLLFFEDNSG